MTLDEAIEHAEEKEIENKKLSKRYDDASGYSRSGNKDIRTNDAKECEKCAEEHRQLAEWLKDYKRLKEQEPCKDCISKEVVINHICESKECYKKDCKGKLYKRCPDIMWVYDLPSAKPKTGHWIYTGDYITDGMLKCSKCGFEHDVSERFFYCPNCGARMSEASE